MSVQDLFEIPFRLLLVAVTILAAFVLINHFTTFFESSVTGTQAGAWVLAGTNIFNSLAGWYFIAIFIGLVVTSFIFAMSIRASIINAPMFFIGTLIATWYSYPLSLAYTSMIETGTFATYSTQMALATMIMSKLPILIIIIGGILALVTYVKFRDTEAQQAI